jgi:hypothetical protein
MSAVALPSPAYDNGDRSQPVREAHSLDQKILELVGRRQRTVGHWLHTKLPDRWVAANRDLDTATEIPYDWQGTFDMDVWQTGTPLQQGASLARSDDPRGCLWGMRLSWRPELWVNFKLLHTLPGVTPTLDKTERSVTWRNVLAGGGHLKVSAGRDRNHKVIRLDTPPTALAECPRIAVRAAPGCTWDIIDEAVLVFYGPDGKEYMRTQPGYGWWGGNEDGPSSLVGGGGVGRVRFVRDGEVGGYGTFRIVPVSGDFAEAWGPLYLDPVTTISGTTDIKDNMLVQAVPNGNWGGDVQVQGGTGSASANWRRTIVWINPLAIPTETITAFSHEITQFDAGNTSGASQFDLAWYLIADADNGWDVGEGTAVGSPQTGSACWNYFAYHASTPTAWSAGAGGPAFVADASPPKIPYVQNPGTVNHSVALLPSWAAYLRDTSDNGLFLQEANLVTQAATSIMQFYSTESGSSPMTFKFTYVSAATPFAAVALGTRSLIHDRRK